MNDWIDLVRVRRSLVGLNPVALERRRRAAVAVVLSGDVAAPELLLVRRSERPSDPWSGHMALPGGHAEPADRSLLQTAQREVREEVGVELTSAELLGQLDDISPLRTSDVSVRPFVFWLAERGHLSLSEEVTEALWVPLEALADDRLRGVHEVELGETRVTVPAFVIQGRVVWGMTFRLLQELLARILR